MSDKPNCASLQSAVKSGNYKKTAEFLEEYGLRVDDTWTDYEILSDAVKTGHPKIVQLLLNHGCRVNKPRANVYSPLHLAVDKNDQKIVKILLDHGASVKAKFHGFTPLGITIKANSPEVAKLLLAHNASVCTKDLQGYTPIHRAFTLPNRGRVLDVMLSVHEGKMSNSVGGGMTIFHVACTRNQPVVIENFLQRNVDVNECVDINAEAWNGLTGLHFAAFHSQEAVARILLKYKANVNKLCVDGGSALRWALQYSFDDEIADRLNESLIKNKTTNEEVGLPVKIVMRFMSQEIKKTQTIQLLVEHKSDVNLINNNGCPLLLEAYRPNILWNISDHIPNVSVIRGICSRFFIESRKKTIKILLSHGIDLDVVNKDKDSILHLIAEDSDTNIESLDIAEMVLKKGAKTNVKNNKGETPLHAAVKNGFYDYVRMLLKYKANPNSADNNLRTPLHDAKDKFIIDLLVARGANVNAKDKEGRTPLLDIDDHEVICRTS